MTKLDAERLELAKRIAKHEPPVQLTTEQLMDAAIKTVKQMSPEEKAKLREQLEKSLRDRKCDPRVH